MSDADQKVESSKDEDIKIEDVKVDVEDGGDEIEVEVKGDDEDDGIPAEEGIEALKKTLEEQRKAVDEERRLRAQAEQQAYQAKLEAQKNYRHAAAATYQSINDSITFLKAHEGSLHEKWVEAKTMGDFNKEAEIQRELMLTAQSMQNLQHKKETMENQFRNGIEEVPQPKPLDPIDAWAETLTPKTADWVRKHKDRLSSEEGRNLVAAAHHKALGQGLRLESEAYFEAVETELGMRRPSRQPEPEDDEDDDGVMSAASAPARKSVAPPSAPVSRGGTRKGAVTLSAAEKEAAEISGVSYEEYYRNKQREAKRNK